MGQSAQTDPYEIVDSRVEERFIKPDDVDVGWQWRIRSTVMQIPYRTANKTCTNPAIREAQISDQPEHAYTRRVCAQGGPQLMKLIHSPASPCC
ncbi:hypothetical protein AL065_26900 [Pseudomonas amygdali pv. ulmi]|nr:hypothetical protein AL065_26900 [Pseudomonas amygdali pv. ulmi]